MESALRSRLYRSHEGKKSPRMKSLVSQIRGDKDKEREDLKEENKELKYKINEMMHVSKKILGNNMTAEK